MKKIKICLCIVKKIVTDKFITRQNKTEVMDYSLYLKI